MQRERVRFTEEKETMLATLYGRARDCDSGSPVLGDEAAAEAVRRIDYDFGRLKIDSDDSISICLRAKQFDRWTREFISECPESNILHLGCGLDTRICRVDPPPTVHWYDLDYPETIELREKLFPERDGYETIPSSVTDLRWLDEVPPDRPTLVVAEGLFYYLTEPDAVRLVDAIVRRFATGALAFDATTRFAAKLGTYTQAAVRRSGAKLTFGINDPRKVEGWTPGLKLETALDLRAYTDDPAVRRFSLMHRAMIRIFLAVPALRRMGLILRYRW